MKISQLYPMTLAALVALGTATASYPLYAQESEQPQQEEQQPQPESETQAPSGQ